MNQILLLLYRCFLSLMHMSGIHRLASSKTRGNGLIFTLHQVNDLPLKKFSPNSILTVKSEFLEKTIEKTLSEGFEIVSLEELTNRLKSGVDVNSPGQKPCVAFTFDDAYRDNLEIAYPIFKKYNLPFTIYVVSDYSNHEGEIWWVALEEIIEREEIVEHPVITDKVFETKTTRQKYAAFDSLYWTFRNADQHEQRRLIKAFALKYNYDLKALVERLILNWDELRKLNKDPLVTLSAHTKSHYAIGQLSKEEAKSEILAGIDQMEHELGERPTHFSFPYGDPSSAAKRDFNLTKELGLSSAVTTRKGMIYKEHKDHITALPRVSLNGSYQHMRYVELFLSGLPFFIFNGMRRLNVD